MIFLCEYELVLLGLYYLAEAGINKKNFVFIVIEDSPVSLQMKLTDQERWFRPYMLPNQTVKDEKFIEKFKNKVKDVFDSVLILGSQRLQHSDKTKYERFKKEVKKRMSGPPFYSQKYINISDSPVSHREQFDIYELVLCIVQFYG